MHGFDALTPVEETMSALDDLVRGGKVRYVGCSNFSGWHLMKSLAVVRPARLAALRGAPGVLFARRPRLRVGAHAAGARSAGGTVVWSPLGWGRLTGKIRRGQPLPETSRLPRRRRDDGPARSPTSTLYRVVDALDEVAKETGRPCRRSRSTG